MMQVQDQPEQYFASQATSSSSSGSPVRKGAARSSGDIPLPGKPRTAPKGFRKNRFKAASERYHSGSSSTTAGESAASHEETDELKDETCHLVPAESKHLMPCVPCNLESAGNAEDPVSEEVALLPVAPPKSKKKAKTIGGSTDGNEPHHRRTRGRHRTGQFHIAAQGAHAEVAPVSAVRLSFVNLTMLEVWQAVEEEAPGVDWMPKFWEVVLTASHRNACKTLALRPLGSWVTIFNKWQALGAWKGQAPHVFNAYDAQKVLQIPWTRVMELMELFNEADSPQDATMQLPVEALISACVMMSKVISKRQKLRFLLGIFDEDDRQMLDKNQFITMLKAFYLGTASLFGVHKDLELMENLASHLFRRILNIYEDQKGEMLDETTSLPYSLMEDWFLGHSDDNLNLPFALFLECFSVPGQEEDPEIFEDESQKFRLCHRRCVELPLETALSLQSKALMQRHEVIAAEKIFSHCLSMGSFDISHADAEKALDGLHMDLIDLWIERLHPVLDKMEVECGSAKARGCVTAFFKELCPKATARHLRMFHTWIKEYQQMEALKLEVRETRQLLDTFRGSQELTESLSVSATIMELLEQHLLRQEETVAQIKRLFSPELQTIPVPSTRFLKNHVPKQTWQSWNDTLDQLNVDGGEEEFRRCPFLPPDIKDLLHRMVAKDSHSFNRARFLKLFCEVFNLRPMK